MIKICETCLREFQGRSARELSECPDDGGRLIEDSDPLVGQVLDGRYRISGLIGAGGMGRIYSARQLTVDRDVAIKTLPSSLAWKKRARMRFMREVKTAAMIEHPNVITIHDFGTTDDGVAWLSMELLAGETLEEQLEDGPLTLARSCHIAAQIAAALEAAHRLDVVHRDLKPSNIMLVDNPGHPDFVKVFDFGLSKILEGDSNQPATTTGVISGTPLYMSPEQVEGKSVDQRTDLYALGTILYETLAGRTPFGGAPMQILVDHLKTAPPALEKIAEQPVPDELRELINQSLAKNPADRPESAAQVRERLQRIAGSLPAPSNRPVTRPAAQPRRIERAITPVPDPVVAPHSASVELAVPESSSLLSGETLQKPGRLWFALIPVLFLVLGVAIWLIRSSATTDRKAPDKSPSGLDGKTNRVGRTLPPIARRSIENQQRSRPSTLRESDLSPRKQQTPDGPAKPPSDPVSPDSSIRLTFRTRPKAILFNNGRRLGLAPQKVSLQKGGSLTIVAKKKGYHEQRLIIPFARARKLKRRTLLLRLQRLDKPKKKKPEIW